MLTYNAYKHCLTITNDYPSSILPSLENSKSRGLRYERYRVFYRTLTGFLTQLNYFIFNQHFVFRLQ